LGFRQVVSILVCVALSGLMPSMGLAGAVRATGGQGQDEGAQQAFRAGVDAAHQERWVDARVLFEKAYGLSPRPVVLINLAGAQARTGQLIEAAENYRRIVDDQTSQETVPFRRAAAEILPALEARIPRVRLRPSGLSSADVIQVDGKNADLEGLVKGEPLDPGEHTLVVLHGGVERARVLFRLAERELRYITLPLPEVLDRLRPAAVASASPALDLTAPAAPASTSERRWWSSPWTWTAVAVTVVGASVATFFLVGRRQDQTFSGNIPPGQISVR
jgi:hypothetical protein